MSQTERQALASGYERMSAWSRLLDQINVYPVADGDTGRNLVVSLAPLRRPEFTGQRLVRALLLSARGNSGNIAARFMEGLLAHEGSDEPLAARAKRAAELARTAVAEPQPGTMLTLLDTLARGLEGLGGDLSHKGTTALLDQLEQAVHHTISQLPQLQAAGVVDAGALGIFLLLEGWLRALEGAPEQLRDVAAAFPAMVAYAPDAAAARPSAHGFCVDAVLRANSLDEAALREITLGGESAVTLRHGDYVKVHLHTDDRAALRARLEQVGQVVQWAWDDLEEQAVRHARPRPEQRLHVITDAAGSITAAQADELGVTLLDSYINLGEDLSVPESHVDPEELYREMLRGVKVSTSQASVYERHQHYQRALAQHGRALYLCVGSVFTGNHQVVSDWCANNDAGGQLTVIDSGAASGKLGVCALATARRSLQAEDAAEVVAFARGALQRAGEFIYIHQLRYLAAGGRLSRGSALFGDLLHLKPVVTPTPQGAQKVGMCRGFEAQLAHAMARLQEAVLGDGAGALIMVEHTDNADELRHKVVPLVERRFPAAEVWLQPVSLTSGAHMGPGTWAVAFLPPEQA